MKRKTIPKYLSRAVLLAGAVCCFGSPSATGANVNVDIIDYAFSPSAVDINVNDTVTWDWLTDSHSSTSESGDSLLWDSGVYDTGHTFSYTFTAAGNYPYYCVVHGFTGSVNVQEAGVPPVEVDIINFAFSPESVTINVDDTVEWVWLTDNHSTTSEDELWNSGVNNTGYTFSYTFTSAGSYPYLCIVHGFTGTVNVVASVPISLTNPQMISATTFQFDYSATPDLTYVVDRATALPAWTPIATNTAATASVLFQDTNAPAGGAYYRVRQANP